MGRRGGGAEMFLDAKLRESNTKLRKEALRLKILKFIHDKQLNGRKTNLNGNQFRETEIGVKHVLIPMRDQLGKEEGMGERKQGQTIIIVTHS